MHKGIEERMQSANRWRDVKDLQKQRRAVESEVQKNGGTCLQRLYFGSDKARGLDRIKGWEAKAMNRLFRFERTMRHGLTITQEPAEWPGKYG